MTIVILSALEVDMREIRLFINKTPNSTQQGDYLSSYAADKRS